MDWQPVGRSYIRARLRAYDEEAGGQRGPFVRLWRYLRCRGCSSMVVEEGIIDEEYYREFLTYFATTFVEYPVTATRLHFFGASAEVVEALLSAEKGELSDGDRTALEYLGYAVVRPTSPPRLGETLIAAPKRICDADCFNHCATRFGQTLKGKRLSVEAAPFIGQNETGMCAQAALWGALKYLHKYRYYPKISLPEITWLASQAAPDTKILRPAGGLSNAGIHAVLRRLGFQLHVAVMPHPGEDFVDADDCLEEIYTGLESGLPVLLLLKSGSPAEHVVWVTGHTLRDDVAADPSPAFMYFGDERFGYVPAAYRVGHILVHDDQAGPYIPVRIRQEQDDHRVPWVAYPSAMKAGRRCTFVSEIVIPLPEEVFVLPSHARRIAASAFFGEHIGYVADFLSDPSHAGDVPSDGFDVESTISFVAELRHNVSHFMLRTYLCLSAHYREYAVASTDMCVELKKFIAQELRLPEYIWVAEVSRADDRTSLPKVYASVIIDSTDHSPLSARYPHRYLALHLPGFLRWRVGVKDAEDPCALVGKVEYSSQLLHDDPPHSAFQMNSETADPPRSHRALGPLHPYYPG